MDRSWSSALCTTLMLAFMVAPSQARSQELPPVNIQQFRLAPGPADYLTVYGTGLTPHLDWTAGFFLNFADAPLRQPGITSLSAEVVDFQTAGEIIGTLGLYDAMEIGLALPVTLLQSSDDLTPVGGAAVTDLKLASAGLGDLRLSPKFEILNLLDGVGLSAVGVLYIPAGGESSFNGDGNFGAEGRLAADFLLPFGIRVGTNAGFRFRPEGRRVRDSFVGNEILFGAGAIVPLFAERLDALVEFNAAFPAGSGPLDEANEGSFPSEVLASLRYALTDSLTMSVGFGSGISEGYGSPDSRVFAGLSGRWVTGGKWHWDYDDDGFLGSRDLCPRQSEDLDGFQDTDGCPDLDNDSDGVPDSRDKCPNSGIEEGSLAEVDADGCPDNDIDGDNIFNDKDKCPEDPEDFDRHEDEDGCPDIDNDKDGVPDVKDSCPDTPENIDGVLDEDGCPELEGQSVVVTKGKIEILQQVYFDTGRSSIKERSFTILDEVAEAMKKNNDITLLQIQGHTDDRGNDTNNLKLSQRRAAAVMQYLTDKHGVASGRLTSIGYGETKPIDDNNSKEGRSRNRRVEFIIISRGADKKGRSPNRFDTEDDLF